MKTIEADFNALTVERHIRLTTRGAERSLNPQNVQPGDWVWLTDGEMKVTAQLASDDEKRLYAVPAWETLIDLEPDPESTIDAMRSEGNGASSAPGSAGGARGSRDESEAGPLAPDCEAGPHVAER